MKKIGHWITKIFMVLGLNNVVYVDAAAKTPGVKAVILYMYDDATVGSNVVSMEVDKTTFMSIVKDTQSVSLSAKPLRFSQNNGFFALLEGESSSFNFATATGIADCDCSCSKRITTTTSTTTTTTTPRTTTTTTTTLEKILSTPAPTYLPPTPPPTYLPPPTTPNPCPSGGLGPYCCLNGANNPDCCENGGKGKYCCTNGQDNPTCSGQITKPTEKPECPKGGSGKYCCLNGADNSDCCENGGKGKFCCLNGANNQNCEIKTTPQPTRRTSTKGPLYLPQPPIITTRGPTTTNTYTYGSHATNSYRYTWSYAPWSRDPKSFTTSYTTTTTPHYYYDPINKKVIYNGEADNHV